MRKHFTEFKKNYLLCALLLAMLAVGLLAAGLTACSGNEEGEHLWDTEWKSNGQFHWHNCLNEGCNERDAMLPHEGWTLVETIDEPTCNEQGRGVYECAECHYQKEDVIPATGKHVFDETTPWQTDEEGHYRICTLCGLAKDSHPHDKLYTVDIKGHMPTDYQDGRREVYCGTCDYLVRRELAPAFDVPWEIKFRFSLVRDNCDWAEDDDVLLFTENLPEGIDSEIYIPYNYRDKVTDNFYRYKVKLEYYDAFNGDGKLVTDIAPNWEDGHTTFSMWYPPNGNFHYFLNSATGTTNGSAVHCVNWELYADEAISESQIPEHIQVDFYLSYKHIAYSFILHIVPYSEYRQIQAEKRGTAEAASYAFEDIDLYFNDSEWKKTVTKP